MGQLLRLVGSLWAGEGGRGVGVTVEYAVRACVSLWECAVGSCPLTKLRCCEVDFTTWRTIECDFHVPC